MTPQPQGSAIRLLVALGPKTTFSCLKHNTKHRATGLDLCLHDMITLANLSGLCFPIEISHKHAERTA